MISEDSVRRELKRLPKLQKEAVRNGKYGYALEIQNTIETIEWLLSDED